MIIAAIYPVFIWFFVFRWRRTWAGFALAAFGVLSVVPVARLIELIGGPVTGGVMAKFVYGEITLVGVVSLWLVLMRRPASHPVCPFCRYDLTGLPAGGGVPGAVCPECGNTLKTVPRGPADPFCLSCGRDLTGLDPTITGHTCPGCGAGEEDFGNWTRAAAVRKRAAAERAQGRTAR